MSKVHPPTALNPVFKLPMCYTPLCTRYHFLHAAVNTRLCPCSSAVVRAQVDFVAKTEYDMVNNYKVLQAGFLKVGIDKVRRWQTPPPLHHKARLLLPPAVSAGTRHSLHAIACMVT